MSLSDVLGPDCTEINDQVSEDFCSQIAKQCINRRIYSVRSVLDGEETKGWFPKEKPSSQSLCLLPPTFSGAYLDS